MNIGKLEEIDIRELWRHEQYNFSNWLAKPENISYLNNILGLTLVDINKEMYVGSYRCDIVAKDETNDTKVINPVKLDDNNFVSEIVIGPKNNSKEVDIHNFISNFFPCSKVTRSDIPYT